MGHGTTSNIPGHDFHKVEPIAGIETLSQNDKTIRTKIPVVSFTSDKYIILNNDTNEPEYLTFYENGYITREIDLDEFPPHAHDWILTEENGKKKAKRKYGKKSPNHWQGMTESERELVYKIFGMI